MERGGERRHALTCLASLCVRAGAVHRLGLTLWLLMMMDVVAWAGRGLVGAWPLLSPLVRKYPEGGCGVCEGCEGRVERGGERRHARTCLASLCARVVAVHRLVLTLWLLMMMLVGAWEGGLSVHGLFCHL